jgi:hypothetical protein
MDTVSRYLRVGCKKVEGWLQPFSARYISEVAKVQNEFCKGAAAVEIGVHHGKLFILLHLAGSRKKDLAIDVFEDQDLNIDRSGCGDRRRFVEHLERWGGDLEKVSIWQKSSLTIAPEEIIKEVGQVALFSVDGGHTRECAYNDLKLADASLREDGVVILDDFFNESWPEVCVGSIDYFNDAASRLKPFALTPGKMYLCTPQWSNFYRENLRQRFATWEFDKEVEMFGSPVQLMGIAPLWLKYPAHTTAFGRAVRRAKEAMKASPIGPVLKRVLGKS